MIGVWGTWVIIAVFCMSPWFDRIGRRKSLFMAYGFIITGGLITVITWARFEAGGSKDIPLGSGIIVGMFVLCWGYGGVLNTFAPTVSSPNLSVQRFIRLTFCCSTHPKSCRHVFVLLALAAYVNDRESKDSPLLIVLLQGYATFNIIVIVLVQVTPLAIEKISWRYFLIFLCFGMCTVL